MRVECRIHGVLLSNTWTTYPWDGDKPGKLGIIPIVLDCWNASRSKAQVPKDGSAAYQVVVGVAYLLAHDGYGL